jgi:hypothetical protein
MSNRIRPEHTRNQSEARSFTSTKKEGAPAPAAPQDKFDAREPPHFKQVEGGVIRKLNDLEQMVKTQTMPLETRNVRGYHVSEMKEGMLAELKEAKELLKKDPSDKVMLVQRLEMLERSLKEEVNPELKAAFNKTIREVKRAAYEEVEGPFEASHKEQKAPTSFLGNLKNLMGKIRSRLQI